MFDRSFLVVTKFGPFSVNSITLLNLLTVYDNTLRPHQWSRIWRLVYTNLSIRGQPESTSYNPECNSTNSWSFAESHSRNIPWGSFDSNTLQFCSGLKNIYHCQAITTNYTLICRKQFHLKIFSNLIRNNIVDVNYYRP